MKLTLCIVALTIMASVEAAPAPGDIKLPTNEEEYFQLKLKSIQGAITDTIKAGMDLEDMEGKLQGIVDASSYFFRTESATEYATAKDAYLNAWNGPVDNDAKMKELNDAGVLLTIYENCANMMAINKNSEFEVCNSPVARTQDTLGKDICPKSCADY